MDAAGELDRSGRCPSIHVEGTPGRSRARYVLAKAADSASGKELSVSETDIQNIVRAKAAIYSACALMVRHLEIQFTDLANIYIGGGFGRFLDIEKAIAIGLIPDVPRHKFHYIGNSSLMGSYIVAVSQEHRRRQLEIAGRMTCIELSTEPTYMDHYTAALFLPHTDRKLFPSVHTGSRKKSSNHGAIS
jgi:uncharacterized 2Fe-2S/4Fe-4S cluster protein (DUF4445 family)